MVEGKIVDVHVHPFTLITQEHMLTELDKAGVAIAVLLALDVDPSDLDRPEIKKMVSNRLLDMYFWDATKVVEGLKDFLEVARTENEQVANFIQSHPTDS